MQILLNSDNHIAGTLELTERVESELQAALDRFANRLTRVEVAVDALLILAALAWRQVARRRKNVKPAAAPSPTA